MRRIESARLSARSSPVPAEDAAPDGQVVPKGPTALVIAPQPFFSPRGTPFSVYYRSLVTAELGVRVDLLTYGEGRDVEIPGVRIIRIPKVPFLGPIKVGPSPQKLLLDGLILIWTLSLLLRNRYDFVHAHEESIFFCSYLKPLFGFKLIYDMHSSLPEQLINYRFTTSKRLIRLFERLEAKSLAAADAVITICPDLATYATARIPDPRRHLLIENSIFEEVKVKGRPHRAALPDADPLPKGRPIVSYAGTFEAYQGLDLLIEGFALARRSRPDAFLLMVGGSPQQVERFQRLAMDTGLDGHCRFTGSVDQALAKRYVGRSAVLTSPRREGSNTPLKIYEQLASGIPLVATNVRSHTQVLSPEVCYLVDPTPQSIAEGIVAALTDDDRRKTVLRNARALYERQYSRPAYEAKMRQLLRLLA